MTRKRHKALMGQIAKLNSVFFDLRYTRLSSKADLNNDMRRGWVPGTTARKRQEDVVRYMAYGYSRERAEELCAPEPEAKPETD